VAITGAWSLVPMSASTGQVTARAATCPVLADIGTSDHAPVMATFR